MSKIFYFHIIYHTKEQQKKKNISFRKEVSTMPENRGCGGFGFGGDCCWIIILILIICCCCGGNRGGCC